MTRFSFVNVDKESFFRQARFAHLKKKVALYQGKQYLGIIGLTESGKYVAMVGYHPATTFADRAACTAWLKRRYGR